MNFQCLWLYFACLFILLIRFLLMVRSYGICLSPPGLFHFLFRNSIWFFSLFCISSLLMFPFEPIHNSYYNGLPANPIISVISGFAASLTLWLTMNHIFLLLYMSNHVLLSAKCSKYSMVENLDFAIFLLKNAKSCFCKQFIYLRFVWFF